MTVFVQKALQAEMVPLIRPVLGSARFWKVRLPLAAPRSKLRLSQSMTVFVLEIRFDVLMETTPLARIRVLSRFRFFEEIRIEPAVLVIPPEVVLRGRETALSMEA